MNRFTYAGVLLVGLVACLSSGCAVPQPRGKGKLDLVTDERYKWPYWIYRPEEYMAQMKRGVDTPVHPATKNGKWPLVVSFHGMKPFDNCYPQALEWQEEADRYGFVMIAPQLRTSDLFMQFPLKDPDLPYVREDVKTSHAAIREVISKMPIDKDRVLSTSWSSGGYMAHYMVNRFPRMFSCLAVRQSNFSAEMLDPSRIRYYRNMPVGVFWTSNDFVICQVESRKAVEWYRRHGFKDFSWGIFQGLGHERTPQSAAALFAMQCGIKPRKPAEFPTLGESHGRLRQAIAYARRASPRAVPAGGLSDVQVAREEAVSTELPDRPSRPAVSRQRLPSKTTATDNGNGRSSPRVTPKKPVGESPASPAPTPDRRRSAEPKTPIVRDYSVDRNPTRPRPTNVVRTRVSPNDRARKVWTESSESSGGTTAGQAPYKPLPPAKKKNLQETPRRQLTYPERTTVTPTARREPSKYQVKSDTRTAARPPKPRNPEPIAPQARTPSPDRTKTTVVSKPGETTSPTRRQKTAPVRRTTAVTPPDRTKPVRSRQPIPKRSTVSTPAASGASTAKPAAPARRSGGQVAVHTSVSVGTSPCYVSFRADLPVGISPTKADFLWTDNGIPICNGQTGEKILVSPGEHRIEVLVITSDNRELRGGHTVTVFRKLTNQRGPSRQYGTHR